MFAVMGAFLIAALAVPGRSARTPCCSRSPTRSLAGSTSSSSPRQTTTWTRATPSGGSPAPPCPAPALLIIAAFLDGTPQALLWVPALAIDFAGPFVFGVRGFRVSPGHFAERFALIVIIALGESIVAIGTGLEGELDAGMVAAALLGLVVAFALWWAYFDVVALVAERHFREMRGEHLVRIARDSYSYLHLPMIAGIVLVALGVKKAIGHVEEPLKTVPAVALFGGIALYYAGHLGFRLRNVRSLNRPRLVAAVACLCSIPLATESMPSGHSLWPQRSTRQ